MTPGGEAWDPSAAAGRETRSILPRRIGHASKEQDGAALAVANGEQEWMVGAELLRRIYEVDPLAAAPCSSCAESLGGCRGPGVRS